ncbi:MAG: hypothetical protein JO053_16055 [Acidobacteria bacterium]|nr:hypothetical protein [Acidobacteriota bacterium]
MGSLFDIIEARERAQEGMEQAAERKASLLRFAQRKAEELGRRMRFVTADDVQRALVENPDRSISEHALGNAAGSLFKDKSKWRWTGETRPSERVSAHGRLIRVWEWIG